MKIEPLGRLTLESFAGLLKTTFRVWIDGQDSLDLELCEITPLRISSTGGTNPSAYEQFALIFRGPADRVLPQRIYLFESAPLGRFELFIVTIGRDANGLRYEATFNRLVKST